MKYRVYRNDEEQPVMIVTDAAILGKILIDNLVGDCCVRAGRTVVYDSDADGYTLNYVEAGEVARQWGGYPTYETDTIIVGAIVAERARDFEAALELRQALQEVVHRQLLRALNL